MELIIGVEDHFDAAHFLPNYNGKCKNMHGHTWYVKVEIKGDIHDNSMVVDLSDLKKVLKEALEEYDHKIINDVMPKFIDPTCERLVSAIKNVFHNSSILQDSSVTLYSVEVKEGEGGWARWEA